MFPSRTAIKEFIRQKAKPASIQRARSYCAELIKLEDNKAEFHCIGSDTYFQAIYFNAERPISTYCSCPYGDGGICKHTVAALEVLAGLADLEHDVAPSAKPKKVVAKKAATGLRLPLSDGLLVLDNLFPSFFRHNFAEGHNQCRIQSHTAGEWVFENNTWGQRFTQTLKKLPNGEAAELRCTCQQKQPPQPCTHQIQALCFIEERLGTNCLADDFLEQKKTEILARYGLSLSDDYQELFEFELNENGLHIINKVPDLMPLDFNYADRTMIERQPKVMKPVYGVALVVEVSDGLFDGLTLVQGKYNKQGELATAFKEITPYNSTDLLFGDDVEEQALDIWNTVQKMMVALARFSRGGNVLQLSGMVDPFNRLLEKYPELPVYALYSRSEQYSTSYARKNLIPLNIAAEPAGLEYRLQDDDAVYRMEARIHAGGKTYAAKRLHSAVTPFFILYGQTLTHYPDAQTAADIIRATLHPSIAVLKQHAAALQTAVIEPMGKRYEIKSRDFIEHKSLSEKQTAFQKQVYVNENDGLVQFRPAAQYHDKLIELPGREQRVSLDENGRFHRHPRDEAAEQAFIAEFEHLHPSFTDAGGHYFLNPEQLVENFWFIDFADHLKQNGIELLGAQNLKFPYNLNKPSLSMRAEAGADWFDLQIDIRYGDESVSLKDIQKAFIKKQNYITLSEGSRGMLPEEWLNRFAHYFQTGEVKKDSIRLSHFQFGIIDELYETLEDKPAFLHDLYQRKQRLHYLSAQPDIQLADGLNARLRPYQQYGLNWLAFLHQNRLGGCLADDMGLGKTLQAIAFLHYLKTTQQPDQPSLIVAPTTLVFNWQAEIEKFCPDLKVLDYTGAGRLKDTSHFAAYDAVLTTYGTLIQDIDLLKEYEFYYAILDESQAIKNPLSQRYKACRLLKAYNRLILSGTPIENNTFDLYAQFNFLNPGLLGSNAHFKKEFADTIDKNKDADSAALLAKIVNPFILRRTKEQVATELPPKTESVIYCEMGKGQRKVYETVKKQYREYLLNKIGADGISKSQLSILEGLTKLRQICNSPAMLEDADYGSESVKLDTLMENIKEKTGQHKILVFSSFVKMLSLIESRLKAEQIAYEYLDGRSRKRQEKVENFQSNHHIRVFLISTKAGGTGLNLTEADYVFIVDPWWNPAVENQAVDRCYRIGQTKHVIAYRMICRDSIEEKILALQQKKQSIADSIVSVDEEKKSFDLDEVRQLFA